MSATHVENSAVLWHLQGCMVTFYSQLHPKQKNKRNANETISFTTCARLDHRDLDLFTMAAPVSYFRFLTTLHLEYNRLTSLPHNLWLLPLRSLNLGHNHLSHLPPHIGLFSQLGELYLHNNQLSSLPPHIGRLSSSLSTLDLSHNPLITLPAELLDMNVNYLWNEGNTFDIATAKRLTGHKIIPSLRDICAQLAGPSIAATGNNENVAHLSPFLLSSIFGHGEGEGETEAEAEAADDLASICSMCHTVLYFPGILLVREDASLCGGQTLPFLYRVCSQACRTKWMRSLEGGDVCE